MQNSNSAAKNILIADDHALIRTGLSALLGEQFDTATILEASNAAQALQIAKDTPSLDLALLDLFLQDMDGFTFLRQFCNTYPALPVIVMSGSTNPAHVRKVIDMGVSGYVPKSVSPVEFADAIKRVMGGGVYIPDDKTLGAGAHENKVAVSSGVAYSLDEVKDLLTARHMQILVCVQCGRSNKQIAREYELSENTVKTHVSAILKILGMANRTEAGILAEKLGIR
jgi:DNA-binding NarL/FixJ family response regulator